MRKASAAVEPQPSGETLVVSVLSKYSETVANIRERLDREVVGQSAGKAALLRLLNRIVYQPNRNAEHPNAPAGALVFIGPTGCGKTFLVEAFARALSKDYPALGHRGPLIRINCAEYQNQHEVARLIGAPPGYLGHRETEPVLGCARLNNAANRSVTGSAVILFDEIEKGHSALLDILLGILEGHLALGDGNQAPLGNAIIVFTSNFGSQDLYRSAPGLGPENRYEFIDTSAVARRYRERLRREWRPELLNRISEIVAFDVLSKQEVIEIAARQFSRFCGTLIVEPAVLDDPREIVKAVLEHEDVDYRYGARDVSRALLRGIEDKVFESLARGTRPEIFAKAPFVT